MMVLEVRGEGMGGKPAEHLCVCLVNGWEGRIILGYEGLHWFSKVSWRILILPNG